MDWAHLLSEGWRFLVSGGVGAFVASFVTNGINHRATARQAQLDRTSRAVVSRRDRTYTDSRAAFMDAVALLGRLDQAVIYEQEGEDPSRSYASPSTVSALEAKLAIFGSTEAAQVFRLSADSYSSAWREYDAARTLDQEERALSREEDPSSPSTQKYAKHLRDSRHEVAEEGRKRYQTAEESRGLLTEIARAQLAHEVEF